MERTTSTFLRGWNGAAQSTRPPATVAGHLLHVDDAGLCSIIVFAPYIFGGRHDLGRLVLVGLIAVTATAWFIRQALLPAARWPQTVAHVLVVLAAAFLILQIVPLPPSWIAALSPRNADLLPLWSATAGQASLGAWRTLSLSPHETTKSLAMLLSYGLLFVVVTGRIQDATDVRKLLYLVAISTVLMAAFGVLQYFTSDGRFFWFYRHPYRSTTQNICGPFTNRNHFADFLVLGVGPLASWLMRVIDVPAIKAPVRKPAVPTKTTILAWCLIGATSLVAAAALASRSRGGAIALLVACMVLVLICWYRGIVDKRFLCGVAGLGAVVVALLSVHGYDKVVDRLDAFADGSLEELDHDGIRQKLWAANLEAIQAGWLTGAGAGSHIDICPVYLNESFNREYAHADNGYLEVGTDTGVIGVGLLGYGIALCGVWSFVCLRHLTQRDEILLFGATAAGLAASLVHSVVDFVWYVPACMSITVVLAGCLLRLAQLARSSKECSFGCRVPKRTRWIELAAATILISGWSIQTYVGPAVATIHWDRYLRLSVEDSKMSREAFERWVAGDNATSLAARRTLSELMVRQLQSAVEWDPNFAKAHRRLADRYMAEFELRASESANGMSVPQVREAALASSFSSVSDLHAWLARAFGSNVELLRSALEHARRAIELCPLAGDAYLYLADLSFLESDTRFSIDAYINQGLRVRPYDRNVLLEAGQQALSQGHRDRAIEYWARCFNTPGPHQKKIAYQLAASGMPAADFITCLQPDWRTLRDIWDKYRRFGSQADLDALLAYSIEQTRRETEKPRGISPTHIWFWQAALYADADRSDEALTCLQQAYACDSRQYFVRRALAQALKSAGRLAEAEPHFRWCLARRPEDKNLSNSLADISRQRIAHRQAPKATSRGLSIAQPNRIPTP